MAALPSTRTPQAEPLAAPALDSWRRVVLENALDAVIGVDEDDVVVEWNRQAEVTFGYAKNEALGRSLTELLAPPESADPPKEGHREVQSLAGASAAALVNRRVELGAHHRNGSHFPVELTVVPVRVDGAPLFYAFVRDISQRKAMERERFELLAREKQLRAQAEEREAQLRLIIDSSPAFIAFVDRNERYQFANKMYEHAFKRREEDQVLLAELARRLGSSRDIAVLVELATRMLAERLRTTRCWFSEIDALEMATVHQDFAQDLPSLKGTYPLQGFGEKMVKSWKTGDLAFVTDVRTDPRTIGEAAAHLALGICAFISAPIQRSGRLVGALNVSFQEPRAWSPREGTLVRAFAESLWPSMENARLILALNESRERLEVALQSATMGAWDWDFASHRITWDATTDALFGVAPGTFPGTEEAFQRLLHPDDRVRASESMQASLGGRSTFDAEYRVVWPDGSVHWLHATGRTLNDETGRARRMLGTVCDITESKRVDEERSELARAMAIERSRITAMLEQMPAGVILAAADGKLLLRNRQMDEILGGLLPTQNILDDGHYVGFRPDGSPYKAEDWPIARSLSRGERVQDEEVEFVRLDGGLSTLSISASPVRDETGNIVAAVVVHMDITARKALESSLKEAVSARDEFLSVASHELRTPVTSMKLRFDAAKRRLHRRAAHPSTQTHESAVEDLEKLVEVSSRQLTRMSRLIEEMLDVSRIAAGRLLLRVERMELSALVREVVERFLPQLVSSHVALTLKAALPVWVVADRARLEQVVENLLTNALKYGDSKPLTVRVTSTAETARVSVIDTGPGIAPENLERIFQRFERATSENISGLGLGLYISRRIVEAHGGRIWAEQNPQGGATFIVELGRKPLPD